MLLYDMPGTGNNISESCYTEFEEKLIEKANNRLNDLKRRLELNENRAYKIDDMSGFSHKSQLVWNKLCGYCAELENDIDNLTSAIENNLFELMEGLK